MNPGQVVFRSVYAPWWKMQINGTTALPADSNCSQIEQHPPGLSDQPGLNWINLRCLDAVLSELCWPHTRNQNRRYVGDFHSINANNRDSNWNIPSKLGSVHLLKGHLFDSWCPNRRSETDRHYKSRHTQVRSAARWRVEHSSGRRKTQTRDNQRPSGSNFTHSPGVRPGPGPKLDGWMHLAWPWKKTQALSRTRGAKDQVIQFA